MNDNEYYTILTLINLCEVDNDFHQKELEFIYQKIKETDFESDKKEKLILEIQKPSNDYKGFFKLIPNTEYRLLLMDIAKVLFMKDGKFCELEKKAYKDLLELLGEEDSLDKKRLAKVLVKSIKDSKILSKSIEQLNQKQEFNKRLPMLYASRGYFFAGATAGIANLIKNPYTFKLGVFLLLFFMVSFVGMVMYFEINFLNID